LLRVYLLIDARHGIGASDREVMGLLDQAAVSYQAVLTKADKIKPTACSAVVNATRAILSEHAAAYAIVRATSAETGGGIAELRAEIAAFVTAHGVRLD
jgi:GTP-binding protein